MKYINSILLSAALLFGLSACDSSSNSDNGSEGTYIQFYNSSANSSEATLELNTSSFTDVPFGDATNVYQITPGNYDVKLRGKNRAGDLVDLVTVDKKDLKKDIRHLFVMGGDYNEPELIIFEYQLEQLKDDETNVMQLHVGNMSTNGLDIDIYVSSNEQTFEEATLLGTMGYGQFSDGVVLDTNEYIVYLTEQGGSEVLFETISIDLTDETVYFLVLRDGFGPGEPKIQVDRITNSSLVSSFADKDADAEYRVFNALESQQAISVTAQSGNESFVNADIVSSTFSDFNLVPFNDYSVTARIEDQVIMNNLLMTLNQGDSVSVLIFEDAQGKAKGLTYSQDPRPKTFENEMNVINVSGDQDDVDVYFVGPNETIETASYVLEGISLEEVDSINIPTNTYEIKVVNEDSNNVFTLLFQSEPIELESGKNYSLIMVRDETSQFGYTVTITQ